MKNSSPFSFLALIALALLGSGVASAQQTQCADADSDGLERWIAYYEKQLPRTIQQCVDERNPLIAQAADAIEKWAAALARYAGARSQEDVLKRIDRLVAAKKNIDDLLERTFEMRKDFALEQPGPQRHNRMNNFLETTSGLIDLSGRLRLQLNQAVNYAAFRVADKEELRWRLIELLAQRNNGIGAAVMANALIDPPPDVKGASPASRDTKARILKLLGQTGERTQLPRLAEFVRDPAVEPELTILAVDTIRKMGVPQDKRPGQSDDLPEPAITAGELHKILSQIPASQLSSDVNRQREELIAWLNVRAKQGLDGDTYRLGDIDVRPGDWLLMRNPSPYNLFTNLSPGLFTHVGVATLETGADGRRRMVLIDLPERGRRIPATNIDLYVERTLHYMFLRHPDPEVARDMADAAASIIGNESEFDLNFRTDGVVPLKGQPLKGKRIKTYCAGLLLLCAQETPLPRERFFPIAEGVAPGATARNLQVMGLSIGKDFISPTGALFSPELQISGRREPMYDPAREVEESIFDHFAEGLENKTLAPSHTLEQTLLIKLAEAAADNPALAEAMRRKENVNIDLVAAARTKAVVDTLDEIAYAASGDFMDAFAGLTAGPLDGSPRRDLTAEKISRYKEMRQRHADLYKRLNELTPRRLRMALVDYYVQQGKREMDKRFFKSE